MQISKAQKNTDNLTVFFALLGSLRAKAAHITLMKLIQGRKWPRDKILSGPSTAELFQVLID